MSVSGRKADASEVLPPKPIVHAFKLYLSQNTSAIKWQIAPKSTKKCQTMCA